MAKITGILIGIIALLLLGFHIWFVYHARALLEDTVEKQTGGKIKLEIQKLHYNYFSRRMVLEGARFYTTDTLTAPSAYEFSIPRLQLKLRALLPLLLDKKLLIDSLSLQSPDIRVTTLREAKDTIRKDTGDISIPYEMGKVYRSIRDGLKVLKVNRFRISNGTFVLINRTARNQLPLRIGNIDFQVENLQVDSTATEQKNKILFSDNIILNSSNQHIIFPDGRHSLSYRRFRINLENQLVQFDSCTIAANRKDSAGTSFRVFFDSLLLNHIDFDTLYRSEVIKADSVYCINPAFSLYVELGSKKGPARPAPRLESIIEQFTGNLQLGYVGVKNGDFNIRTTRDGKPSSFVSRQNNFDMEGLQVDRDADKPIRVKSFAMAIRNYENFIRDSSYRIRFDSILFRDDRITLSNFNFQKLNHGKIINTFSVPRFSLEGLSWDQLVFEKRIRARLAAMYQPHISYTASAEKKQSIFQSLGALNEYMDLDQLDITDGEIDLHLRNQLQVQLNHADLSIQSNSLLTSTRLSGIRNSLTSLLFTSGTIRAGDLQIDLSGIRYNGNSGQLHAASAGISDAGKHMDILIRDATIQQLVVDEQSGNIDATGISWENGNLMITSRTTPGNRAHLPQVHLKNILGRQTRIHTTLNGLELKTNLEQVGLDELYLAGSQAPVIRNLIAAGNNLQVQSGNTSMEAQTYRFADQQQSMLTRMKYQGGAPGREDSVFAPAVSFVPDLESLLKGKLNLKYTVLDQPVIGLRFLQTSAAASSPPLSLSHIRIDDLLLRSPVLHISNVNDKGRTDLYWNGRDRDSNQMQLRGLSIDLTGEPKLRIEAMQAAVAGLNLQTAKGKPFSTGNGSISFRLNDLYYTKKTDDNPEWGFLVSELATRSIAISNLGKNNGLLEIEQARLEALHCSDNDITRLRNMVTTNPLFKLRGFTGRYTDRNSRFSWYNTGFSRHDNIFSLDSFSYSPVMERDSFLASRPYQSDYIQASCGALRAGPLLPDAWLNDTVLHLQKLEISQARLTDYKDRTRPFNTGLIKPLPVNLLKKIPLYLQVDTTHITHAAVEYTELQKETRHPVVIPVQRMNVVIEDIRNKNRKPGDSLFIKATGYLLDTVWVKLQVKQSYTDSLGGFLMTARLKGGDIRTLNPVLTPLAAVKLISGTTDTIDLRAVGREYLAIGEMKMFYSNLKVELLKSPADSAKTLMTRLKNLIAGIFVIRRNNHSRTGDVFFIRQRDRSAINYLVRIVLSGIASSVGARNHKKMMRRYEDELKKRNLPPVDMD